LHFSTTATIVFGIATYYGDPILILLEFRSCGILLPAKR